MARPRKQTYTMIQYLSNVTEGYISNDADTQRNPAWKPIIDGLAVTILTEDYIPSIILAEEECGQIHIVDGGSRTAAFQMIRYGNYKIKSSVEDPIIKYKGMSKDENGKIVWNEKEFDIRNKTFEQFPKELQKKFDEYQVDTVVHENCDKNDIAKYIKRYNEHKSMNANQKMFTHLSKFAEKIRDITNNLFFSNNCIVTEVEKEKGMLERIVAETVMATNFFDKWNKNAKKLAVFVNENATDEMFDRLNNNVKRLEIIVDNNTKGLFNSKDSFIWLTLFDKFTSTGLNDGEFGEFLNAFINGLNEKEVDGNKFSNIDASGSTKDKSNVVMKLHVLESLMNEYLHIENVKNEDISVEEFISKMVGIDVEDVKLDIEMYRETLADLENNTIKDGSKLLDLDNKLSMLALVAYSYKNEVDLDKWMTEYANKNNMYIVDQKRNYETMLSNFKEYMKGEK